MPNGSLELVYSRQETEPIPNGIGIFRKNKTYDIYKDPDGFRSFKVPTPYKNNGEAEDDAAFQGIINVPTLKDSDGVVKRTTCTYGIYKDNKSNKIKTLLWTEDCSMSKLPITRVEAALTKDEIKQIDDKIKKIDDESETIRKGLKKYLKDDGASELQTQQSVLHKIDEERKRDVLVEDRFYIEQQMRVKLLELNTDMKERNGYKLGILGKQKEILEIQKKSVDKTTDSETNIQNLETDIASLQEKLAPLLEKEAGLITELNDLNKELEARKRRGGKTKYLKFHNRSRNKSTKQKSVRPRRKRSRRRKKDRIP